ncbi:MAG: hypothetical protein J0L84_08495 [Verrucomicrobia bacterium]|nr:hypothetical protein [Verrucomicrobiota bacterium]
MSTPNVMTPESVVRLAAGQSVTVREMRWPQMRVFLDRLGGLANSLGAALRPAGPAPGGGLAEVGASVLTQLPELIRSSSDLSEELIRGCVPEVAAGRLILDDLAASDALRLLDASLAVTLNEEVLGLGKSVAGRVAAVMAPATPLTRPSPLSSTP